MTAEEALFDPGHQPERTALAWQRTVLALGAGGLILSRGLAPQLAWLSLGVGIASVAFAMTALVGVHRRYRGIHAHLTRFDATSLPTGGGLIFATGAFVAMCGIVALVVVLGL